MQRATLASAIDWSDPQNPRSAQYGDVFASRAGALPQAQGVFLRGNGLPERWQGRDRFTILETGFGLGNNFLCTWDSWRQDPQRSKRLFFLSLDAHPASLEDLQRVHAHSPLAERAQDLLAQWPPRVAGWHTLSFDGGAVQLLLAFGDIADVLPQWSAEVDAFFLDGFSPKLNPAMWTQDALAPLGKLAAAGATAATWTAARSVHRALQAAGFVPQLVAGFGGKTHMTVAHFTPRHRASRPPGLLPVAPHAQEAVVLGAGLAGAACARALQSAGLAVQVWEAEAHAANQASGNPAGLFHATVHPDDGPHARWSRQAALRCRRWVKEHPPPWQLDGLLRLSPNEPTLARDALVAHQQLDARFAQAVGARAASQHAGLALDSGGWWFPGGGALSPRDWVLRLLEGLPLHTERRVSALRHLPDGRWLLLDALGEPLLSTSLLVLAPGAGLSPLLQPLDRPLADWLQTQRGQLSHWRQGPALQHPLAAGGYALRTPQGDWFAGATATFDDADPTLRSEDQAHNRTVAERLVGQALPAPDGGRVGWRVLTPDKLPLVGSLIDPVAPTPSRGTLAVHWPRRAGLLVCGAMASRGITWAPLAAELVVAQALGWPLPVPRTLTAAVDPARHQARLMRS
jgi:tRNA 5-methylaminomethyl-2-thiouridine biosynthesis bifunctional protein